ncbi:MAG: hypothetical protein PHF35_03510 [Candidatus Moranbacteria bacterium]|nr:hypothetical protein [Candidatus Moranbacteria bacterium]
MDNFIKKTLEKIKEQDIRPDSRWKYLAKKYSAWLVLAFTVLFCAVSASAVAYLSSQLDWDIPFLAHGSGPFSFFKMMPYFWIVLAVLLAALAFFEIRRTERGYKFSRMKIFSVLFAGFLVFGFFSTQMGWGRKADQDAKRNLPFYGSLVTTKETQWSQPDKGLLGGTIESVDGNGFSLEDFSGKNWSVVVDESADIRTAASLSEGEKVKVIGSEEAEDVFQAKEVRPWEGKGLRRGQNGNGGGQSGRNGGGKF